MDYSRAFKDNFVHRPTDQQFFNEYFFKDPQIKNELLKNICLRTTDQRGIFLKMFLQGPIYQSRTFKEYFVKELLINRKFPKSIFIPG